MTWNYRVVRHRKGDTEYLALHEVFYTNGKPDGITLDGCDLVGYETPLELMRALVMMVRDVWRSRHDILNYKDF